MYEIKNNNYRTMYEQAIKQSFETSSSHLRDYNSGGQSYLSMMAKQQNSNYDIFKLK